MRRRKESKPQTDVTSSTTIARRSSRRRRSQSPNPKGSNEISGERGVQKNYKEVSGLLDSDTFPNKIISLSDTIGKKDEDFQSSKEEFSSSTAQETLNDNFKTVRSIEKVDNERSGEIKVSVSYSDLYSAQNDVKENEIENVKSPSVVDVNDKNVEGRADLNDPQIDAEDAKLCVSDGMCENIVHRDITPQMDIIKCFESTEDVNKPIRKRKWISKKVIDCKEPILAISSDSLKDLITGVDMVPLSDIKFDSSSEFENSQTDREDGEKSPTPERKVKLSGIERSHKEIQLGISDKNTANEIQNKNDSFESSRLLPLGSQSRNVLYITNLVRPFTVLQLKGLLARTGKIVENGFWIDRIKSKCYVQYETEEEAVETRHALHGVRWPVSNPKCLNVEFGKRENMENAMSSSTENTLLFGGETLRDAFLANNSWEKEIIDSEKKSSKSIREWDVGKKNSVEREKKCEKVREYRRSHEKDFFEKSRNTHFDLLNSKENGKDRRIRFHNNDGRETCHLGKRSIKKESDPPIRLLDDLFRKTKTTPCVYWLPLTPEQISDKELFRLKRIEEHRERVKQRELERMKEREKEHDCLRVRERHRTEKERDRIRDNRRNHSSDRHHSKSRDRRR